MAVEDFTKYIPFFGALLTALGYGEVRLNKKVGKSEFHARMRGVDRLEIRMMRLEGHLIGKVLTTKEVDEIVKKNNHYDVNIIASQIVSEETEEEPTTKPVKEKNPAAVALGRLGGLKGGKARAKKLSAKRRKEIAQKAAKTRWGNK